jgi:hypothetical protein
VMPSINVIVVTTASGFEYDQISLLLAASFIDPDNPLPANPEGMAQLESALADVAQAPHPWQTGPLPDTASEISNETYILEPNGLELSSLRLKFRGNKEATLYINLQGRDLTWPIGLDGEYRVEPDGRALRGYWPDAQTFIFEIYEDGLSRYQLHFEQGRIILETPFNQINGQVENP